MLQVHDLDPQFGGVHGFTLAVHVLGLVSQFVFGEELLRELVHSGRSVGAEGDHPRVDSCRYDVLQHHPQLLEDFFVATSNLKILNLRKHAQIHDAHFAELDGCRSTLIGPLSLRHTFDVQRWVELHLTLHPLAHRPPRTPPANVEARIVLHDSGDDSDDLF